MAVITRQELENAQRDVSDLGKVVNGSSTLANPAAAAPLNVGTVSTREGQVVKTLSRVVADGFTSVEARLTPIIYSLTAQRDAALTITTPASAVITPGRTCYDKEDTNLYICTEEDDPENPGTLRKVWSRLSNLENVALAELGDILRGVTKPSIGAKISIANLKIMQEVEKNFDNNALEVHHIRFPIKNTLYEGLAKMMGYNTAPLNSKAFMQSGVDFGCRIPFEELVNASSPEATAAGVDWAAPTNRVLFRNNVYNVLEGYYVLGSIDISNIYAKDVTIRDCYIDGNYNAYAAIGKSNVEDYAAYVEYCTLRRFINDAMANNYGHVAFCDIEYSRGDALKASGHDVHYHGNMIRVLGFGIPSAHADGLQVWDCSRLTVTQNTFWMPGTSTYYDEGTYGSTQILRFVTEHGTGVLEEVYCGGNILAGAGHTISVRARYAGSLVQNMVIANNIVAGNVDGYPIPLYGVITTDHQPAQTAGTVRNLLFHDNKMSDGRVGLKTSPPGQFINGPNQEGMWYYDKQYASEYFMELGKRYGYLDWNGDLKAGVPNYGVGGVMPT